MVQQINLYDAALAPRRERWRAVHGLWVVGGTLVFAVALSSALNAWAARRVAQAQLLEQQATAERPLLTRPVPGTENLAARMSELDRLRALDGGQRRVQMALQAQVAGRSAGYTPYFLALSRQAHPALWITGLAIAADGDGLEIQGRMTDAAVLPDYLRHLEQEPQFKGRSFAQLSLKAADAAPADAHAEAGPGYTEFVLRSQAAGAQENPR